MINFETAIYRDGVILMKKRVADILVETLIANGVTNAFSVVGGGAMHLNNAFALRKDVLKTTYNHHEQASAMAAEAYARLTGQIAAVCVCGGPGALNTLNGVQSAWVDSIPMIVISGHPRYNTTVNYSNLEVRCIGVQENDIIPQVRPITKYAKMVTDPLSIWREVQYAIDCAMDGRRGPVWLTVPLDIQGTMVEEDELYGNIAFSSPLPSVSEVQIAEVVSAFQNSERPCILSGSGIRTSNAIEEYQSFLNMMDVPVVCEFGAPDNHFRGEKNYYGMSGASGPRSGNFILQNSDFLLVLGDSLSSTQTGFNVSAFAPHARIIMVDATIDESKKIGLHVTKCIWGDLKDFFSSYIRFGVQVQAPQEWKSYCDFLKNSFPAYEVLNYVEPNTPDAKVHPSMFWKIILEKAEKNAVFALGNSSCVAGILTEGISHYGQRVIENYHSGSMGIDLPFAIGSAEGCPSSPVYCATGDGCFMMNLQELQTIKYNGYKIKIIIFNNNGYDNIRMTCRNYFNGLGNGCDPESGISMPDFRKVADAFGFPFHRVSCVRELEEGVDWLLEQDEACILEIVEKRDKERAPVIKSIMGENGQFQTPPLHVMSPLLPDEKMKEYTRYC